MSTTALQFRYELMSGVEITRAEAETMAAAGVPVRRVLLPETAAKQPRAIELVKSIDVYANGGPEPVELHDYIDPQHVLTPVVAAEILSPRFVAVFVAVLRDLQATAKLVAEIFPTYREGSYTEKLHWDLDRAIARAEELLHGR